MAGMSEEKIADYLGLAKISLSSYVYRASKNGWLDYNSSREAIEHGLAHKVIRNLDEALDDDFRNVKTGVKVKTAVALKVAEGTMFKDFGDSTTGAAPVQTAISIRIEQPREALPMREGTIGGVIDVTPE